MSETDLFDQVDQIFREQINPAVAQHGGRVDLIDVEDGIVTVRMMGGCQGCGMANQTLKQGIEASLKDLVPGIREVRDITDHGGGANPYYA
jgi:Fe/S biogenesis protein NfuA